MFSCTWFSWADFWKLAESNCTRKRTQRLLQVLKGSANWLVANKNTLWHKCIIYTFTFYPEYFCSGNFNHLQWLQMLCLNRTLNYIPMRWRGYGCDALWGLMAIMEYFMSKRIESWSQRARMFCLPLHTKVQVWLTLTCKFPQDI